MFERHESVDDDVAEQVWDVFEATYTTTGSRGARGKKAKRYVVPFHPVIAKHVEPHETRNWGDWYRMLMSSGRPAEFNQELHDAFVARLEGLEPSNLFEQVFVDVIGRIETEAVGEPATDPLRPYVDECASAFQSDLRRWLDDEYDSPSNWLQSTRDLFCFHFMMYYAQLALNLEREFDRLAKDPERDYEPEIKQLYFGLWDEKASQDRRFRQEWRARDQRGVEGHVYDSWGRLAVLNEIAAVVERKTDREQTAVTLSEAMALPDSVRRTVVVELCEHLPDTEPSDDVDLPTVAQRMTNRVRSYYEEKTQSNQTPISMGINVVRQLGDGGDRKYWRTQRKIGPTFRLNRGALRFFARLFAMNEDDTHYDEFVSYLQRRGIFLDSKSERYALEELDEMGMIDRQSDSGGAVYVRSL
ncbi:DNA phosphorothioation-dependent restriction protein DptG [Halorubellus litoreus]|uniref:DNA phosphorothioation-dependent restriction protein DptG n=1 Tax=Halorubellus litoreus TaxID=755308 RepID=A0ABD5VP17_9EURY